MNNRLLDTPAAIPPDECVDKAVWRLAHGLYADHLAGADGACARCPAPFPCLGQRLARLGLATALGEVNAESDYWTTYARILAIHNDTASDGVRLGCERAVDVPRVVAACVSSAVVRRPVVVQARGIQSTKITLPDRGKAARESTYRVRGPELRMMTCGQIAVALHQAGLPNSWRTLSMTCLIDLAAKGVAQIGLDEIVGIDADSHRLVSALRKPNGTRHTDLVRARRQLHHIWSSERNRRNAINAAWHILHP